MELSMKKTSRQKRYDKPPVAVVSIDNDLTKPSHTRIQQKKKRIKPTPSSRRRSARERNLLAEIVVQSVKQLSRGASTFLLAIAAYFIVAYYDFDANIVINRLRKSRSSYISANSVKLHIPSDLDPGQRRSLSLNLGGGDCLWQVK